MTDITTTQAPSVKRWAERMQREGAKIQAHEHCLLCLHDMADWSAAPSGQGCHALVRGDGILKLSEYEDIDLALSDLEEELATKLHLGSEAHCNIIPTIEEYADTGKELILNIHFPTLELAVARNRVNEAVQELVAGQEQKSHVDRLIEQSDNVVRFPGVR